MLHSGTVTLQSSQHCTVCLPFIHFLLEDVYEAVGSINDDVENPREAAWLARALAEATAEKFRSDAAAADIRTGGLEIYGPFKKNHKEESFDLGTEACYVKQCASVRPAFVLEAQNEDTTRELMYLYTPMGLEREHDMQGSVLGRFGSYAVAACFLQVASEKLGVGYTPDACTNVIPEAAQREGSRETIQAAWQAALQARPHLPCYNITPEQHITEAPGSWEDVRQTVLGLGTREHEEALELLDRNMRHT